MSACVGSLIKGWHQMSHQLLKFTAQLCGTALSLLSSFWYWLKADVDVFSLTGRYVSLWELGFCNELRVTTDHSLMAVSVNFKKNFKKPRVYWALITELWCKVKAHIIPLTSTSCFVTVQSCKSFLIGMISAMLSDPTSPEVNSSKLTSLKELLRNCLDFFHDPLTHSQLLYFILMLDVCLFNC